MRVPKVVMQEVKRRQQLIELRKTDSGIEYKNFDYVCCQENGRTPIINGNESGTYENL